MLKKSLLKMLILTAIAIFINAEYAKAETKEPKGITLLSVASEKKDSGNVKPAEPKYSIKTSGFFTVRGTWSDKAESISNFDLRFARVTFSGNLTQDFSYKFQSEFTGGGAVRVLDLFATWKKYSFLNISVGQQKRCFTFENYIAPFAISVMDYSQSILLLSGFNDRVGEHASGGRDVGISAGGEFFNTGTHNFFKYALGVFNGQGINEKDKNNNKDVIGSISIQPIKNLYIGGGYWNGKFGPDSVAVKRDRWTVGVNYTNNGYYLRSEYISSKGGKLNNKNASLNSDGWYALAEVPVLKKFGLAAKYDTYRDDKSFENAITKYHAGINWYVNRYVILQGSYVFTNDKSKNQDYNNVAIQMTVRY